MYLLQPSLQSGMDTFTASHMIAPYYHSMLGLTLPPNCSRLARRGGVVRIQKAIYKTVREIVVSRLQTVRKSQLNTTLYMKVFY